MKTYHELKRFTIDPNKSREKPNSVLRDFLSFILSKSVTFATVTLLVTGYM
jgi:hypothetical protein